VNQVNENAQVLNLVQAMLGSISPNFRAVCLLGAEGSVALRFILEQANEADREEIDEIVFEFEALQSSGVAVDVEVVTEAGILTDEVLSGRLVFSRRE
jgi:hypothetical protein